MEDFEEKDKQTEAIGKECYLSWCNTCIPELKNG